MMQMMDMNCWPFMMVIMALGGLLGLAPVGSLIALLWVVIGRLRRTSVGP